MYGVLPHFGPGDLLLLQNETNLVGEAMEKAAGSIPTLDGVLASGLRPN